MSTIRNKSDLCAENAGGRPREHVSAIMTPLFEPFCSRAGVVQQAGVAFHSSGLPVCQFRATSFEPQWREVGEGCFARLGLACYLGASPLLG